MVKPRAIPMKAAVRLTPQYTGIQGFVVLGATSTPAAISETVEVNNPTCALSNTISETVIVTAV